jgi:hypothetical protein
VLQSERPSDDGLAWGAREGEAGSGFRGIQGNAVAFQAWDLLE